MIFRPYVIISYDIISFDIISFDRRLGGESNREIVSFRCVRAGEAKLRERVRASVSFFARLQNRISLAGPCRAVPCPVCRRRCFIFL